MEIKDLVSKWRALNTQLKATNEGLEAARNDFHRFDADHAAAVSQWEAQKEALTHAIKDAREKIGEAKRANAAIVREAEQTLAKATERRQRNEDHSKVLASKREELAAVQRTADADDQVKAEALHSFRRSREHLKEQLQTAIDRLSQALPTEKGNGESKLDELAKKTAAIHDRIRQEDAAWRSEVAQRRSAKRRAFSAELEKERVGCSRAEAQWEDLRRHVPAMTDVSAFMAEIAELRSHVQPQRDEQLPSASSNTHVDDETSIQRHHQQQPSHHADHHTFMSSALHA